MNAPAAGVLTKQAAWPHQAADSSRFLNSQTGPAYHAIVLSLSIAVLVGAVTFQVDEGGLYLWGIKLPVRCLLYDTLGIKCALCGLSRSMCYLAHGDLQQSLRFHAFGPAIFAFICLQIPYRISGLWKRAARIHQVLSHVNLVSAAVIAVGVSVNWLSYIGGLIL